MNSHPRHAYKAHAQLDSIKRMHTTAYYNRLDNGLANQCT